jgi:HAD superfamily hydrolase (TIGR01509 family)
MTAQWRAIIFDYNGVLVDDEPIHMEMLRRVLAAEGITVSDGDYQEKYLGSNDRACFTRALEDAGRPIDAPLIDELIRRKAALYRRAIDGRDIFFPGAVALVNQLAASYPLALVSGARREEIEAALARSGIGERFRALIAAEDVARGKPDPEGYLKALAALDADGARGITAAECLVIEDTVAGVAAARRAGMRVLAVTTSYPADALRAADWISASLAGIDPSSLG